MALFDVVRKQLAIRKARKRARENPSPSTLAELAQTYFDREQPQQAFRSLQHAVNLYPDSQLLRDLAAHLRRSDFERQVRMLGQLVEESPEDLFKINEFHFRLRCKLIDHRNSAVGTFSETFSIFISVVSTIIASSAALSGPTSRL